MKSTIRVCVVLFAGLLSACTDQPPAAPPPWFVPERATLADSLRILSARSPAQDAAANITAGYFGLLGNAEMGGYDFPGLRCQQPRMGRQPGSSPTNIERIFDKLYWHLETWGDLVDNGGKDPWHDYAAKFDAYAAVYNRIVVAASGFPYPSACKLAPVVDQHPLPQ